jgi:hypothetical protein
VVTAFEGAWRQFIDVIRGLDPADGSRPVPHLDWTVAEMAAHVLTVLRRAGDPRRAVSIA